MRFEISDSQKEALRNLLEQCEVAEKFMKLHGAPFGGSALLVRMDVVRREFSVDEIPTVKSA